MSRYYKNYSSATAADSTLPTLLNGTDDRPVLVELQWDINGVYDLGQGIWLPSTVPYYVLMNGRNSTIRFHWEDTFVNEQTVFHLIFTSSHNMQIPDESPGVHIHWNTGQLFPCWNNICKQTLYPRYILNFNIGPYKRSTTLGKVTQIYRSGNKVTSVQLVAPPLHPSFFNSAVKYNHVDEKGRANIWEAPYSNYGGYSGNVTSKDGLETEQGTMVLSLSPSEQSTLGPLIQVGHWFGLQRQGTLSLGGGASVVQGINMLEMTSWIETSGVQGFDLIDVHLDRLNHNLFVWGSGPLGQVFNGGIFRLYHNSMEDGSDDNLDNISDISDPRNGPLWKTVIELEENISRKPKPILRVQPIWRSIGNSDIIQLNTTLNGVKLTRVNGWQAGKISGMCPPTGTQVAFSRYPDAFVWVYFKESISELKPLDVAWWMNGNPTLLHIKNYRGGNHNYNLLNIKAQTIIVDNSFMYNTTMGCVDVSSDTSYWREGNPVQHMTVRDNVFQGCFSAVQHVPSGRDGIPPNSALDVSITNNWFYANASLQSPGWFPNQQLILYAVANLNVSYNTFVLTPGMRSAPLIQMCNTHDGIFSNNLVVQGTLMPGQYGGITCNRTTNVCPSYPLSHSVFYAVNGTLSGVNVGSPGCSLRPIYNVAYECNSFNNTSACQPVGAAAPSHAVTGDTESVTIGSVSSSKPLESKSGESSSIAPQLFGYLSLLFCVLA
ncbi:hypothetical protein PROFUN_05615 [Planoprotostelium fungivorum]|uniref:Uncharacterized protein n=1 Tax=Planoprotostelium fungivorum TaxID=1890364 RepID=A0A2P6MUE8_9EUKA|nr:hypothetical protein PROFUN_05615 [Planoprotostelium fungivorum]